MNAKLRQTHHLWASTTPGYEEPQPVNVPTLSHIIMVGTFIGAFEEYELWELYGKQYHVNIAKNTVTPA